MKSWSLLGAVVSGVIVFMQACSPSADSGPDGPAIHCTPGANVFCRCIGSRIPGTKQCRADGVSFDACVTGDDGECVGGEDLTDPNNGKPVEPIKPVSPTEPDAASPVGACPGRPVAVGPTETILEGDTTGSEDHGKGKAGGACAVGGGGPDQIYHVQPTGSGSLQIKVQGLGAMNPTIYLRSTCEDENTQIACGETTGPGGAEKVQRNVLAGHSYYLYVDGASGTSGKYAVTLKLTPGPFCGDGKVDTNEACDDMNNVDGDGCSAGCTGVGGDPVAGGSCPGQPVHVWPGKTVSGAGSTTDFGNTFSKTGTSCLVSANDLNAAQDHVYAVTAHAAGTLRVKLKPTEATFNTMLVARQTCSEPSTQIGGMCANSAAAGGEEVMNFAVGNNQTTYVAADGITNHKGNYTISFELL